MATQTETYKFNKPARTDNIDVEKLNENFDIMEEELKKRPLSSDVATTAFYDLDLTSWITVEFAGYTFSSGTTVVSNNDSVLPGGAAALLTAVENGRLPRIKFKDNNDTDITVVLDSCETSVDGETTITDCNGTVSNVIYDVIDSYRIKVEENAGDYAVTFYAQRNVSGAGTVKSVNGVQPDDDGNVEVSVAAEEPATTKLDFTNWSNGSFTEHLDDGSTVEHTVARDTDGNITAIGGIVIAGVG